MRIENRLDLDSRQNNLVVVSELIVLVCAASRARELSSPAARALDRARDRVSTHTPPVL